VEVKLTVNEFYIQSVIDDRKKEVSKIVEDNQIYSHLRGSAANQRESDEKGKNVLSLWLLTVANRLKGVFEINNEGSVKV
jgi:hypothetical protein